MAFWRQIEWIGQQWTLAKLELDHTWPYEAPKPVHWGQGWSRYILNGKGCLWGLTQWPSDIRRLPELWDFEKNLQCQKYCDSVLRSWHLPAEDGKSNVLQPIKSAEVFQTNLLFGHLGFGNLSMNLFVGWFWECLTFKEWLHTTAVKWLGFQSRTAASAFK